MSITATCDIVLAMSGTETTFARQKIWGEIYTSQSEAFGGGKVRVIDMRARNYASLLQVVRKSARHGWRQYLKADPDDLRAVLFRPL